jgi:hypothetical protein
VAVRAPRTATHMYGANMASTTLYAALAANPVVSVDLLLAAPQTSDQSTFVLPTWEGYTSALVVFPTRTVQGPGSGLYWDFEAAFLPTSGSWPVWGVALSFEGQAFAVSPFDSIQWAEAGEAFRVHLTGQLNAQI